MRMTIGEPRKTHRWKRSSRLCNIRVLSKTSKWSLKTSARHFTRVRKLIWKISKVAVAASLQFKESMRMDAGKVEKNFRFSIPANSARRNYENSVHGRSGLPSAKAFSHDFVEQRNEKDCQYRRGKHSADDAGTDVVLAGGARAGRYRKRNDTGDERERCHQDRT